MICAIIENEEKIMADDVNKQDGPFYCPECKSELILKKGKIKILHFAHKPPVNCIYGEGETYEHNKAKKQIYDYLFHSEKCLNIELEKYLESVRPDVYFEIRNQKIAIEVQKSTINVDDIYRRMIAYGEKGIFVIWLIPYKYPKMIYDEDTKSYIAKMKEWHFFLHTIYYGELYILNEDSSITALHLEKFERTNDGAEWYTPEGEYESRDARSYIPKTLRKISIFDMPIHIDVDFIGRNRTSSASFGKYAIPNTKIWKNKKVWWK